MHFMISIFFFRFALPADRFANIFVISIAQRRLDFVDIALVDVAFIAGLI